MSQTIKRQEIIYVAGGTVQAGDGIYLERPADRELLSLCVDGKFTYILTSREMGKSSLMVRTAEALLEQGIKPVILDLSSIGVNVTADQWYRGVITAIADSLDLPFDVAAWWSSRAELGPTQKFTQFLFEVLERYESGRVVIFVDEIATT